MYRVKVALNDNAECCYGDGVEWKVFKWVVKTDTQDRIEIDRMCLGMSEVGKRVR